MSFLFKLSIIVLKSALSKNFAEVHVDVVDCPDLTEKPWNLAAEGIKMHIIVTSVDYRNFSMEPTGAYFFKCL